MKKKALEPNNEVVKTGLAELEVLSERAQSGDRQARRKLRKAVLESSPEVVARASDIA